MLAYDVFLDDAFSVAELREQVNDLVYIPDELNRMGLFMPDPIRTTNVMIAKNTETLALVPLTERGAAKTRLERDARNVRYLPTFRLAQEDRIHGDSLQNIAVPGTPYDVALGNAMDEVEKRQRKMMRKLELTREYHRLAALNGYVKDADGSVVLDVYDEFAIARPAAVLIDVTPATEGGLRAQIYQAVIRPMTESLQASGRNAPRGILALCGDDFYDALVTAPEIYKTYLNTQQARELREGFVPYDEFNYAGVTWRNYRGNADATIGIADNQCIFIPVGVEDMFVEFRAPGEDFRTANEPGREFYSTVSPDYRPNKFEWVDIDLAAYPLYVCLVLEAMLIGQLAP